MHIYFPNIKNNYNPVYKSIFGKRTNSTTRILSEFCSDLTLINPLNASVALI